MSNEVALKNEESVQVHETGRVYRPVVNVSELNDVITLEAEMPGVSAEGLNVVVEKHQLTIEGVIESISPEGYEAVYSELPNGKYQRTFNLSDVVDVSAITADLVNGLLTLTLPKIPKAVPRKIEIGVA